jgi:hypothetical protein
MKSFRKHLSEVAAVKPRKAPKKFPGYWAGKDSAKASRSKMVGGESITSAPSGQDYLKEFENFNDKVNNGVDVVDRGEYDREGSMVKDNLTTIHREIKELYKLLGDDENLPEWVQEKIAQAKGMITSASEYMQTQHERDPVNELSVKAMSDYYKKRDADLRSKLQGAKTATATDKSKTVDKVADKLKQMKLAVAKIKAKKTAATEIKEAPIEMDPAEPMNPMIHNHQGANPAKLQYRMARAAAQFKELAKRAENGSAIGWESIARQFGELAMNVEQIKHGLDELATIRKKGGRGSRGIDPNIGEAAPVVPGAPVPGAVPDPIEVKKAQIQQTQSGKLASVVGASPAALDKALAAAGKGISTPATAQAFLPTLDDIAKVLQDPTLGPQLIALLAKAKQIK